MPNNLARYVGRQAVYTALVMGIASILVFLALRLASGDPVNAVLNSMANTDAREAMRAYLGLNLPIWQQYLSYLVHIAHGDFGVSFLNGSNVGGLIVAFGQRTLLLAGTALVLTYLVAIPLGVVAAVYRNSIWDQTASFMANLAMAVPNFWMALLFILLFSVQLRWLPVGGTGTVAHLVLPVIVLSAEGIAVTLRLMRTSMLEQLGQDYVRTLRAKGLSEARIIWLHVVRNALTPIVSLAGLRFGWLLGYTLIVETVFRWPGLGFALVDAVLRRDYPVAQSLSLLLTLTVVLGNFLANIAHAWVDPRVANAEGGR